VESPVKDGGADDRDAVGSPRGHQRMRRRFAIRAFAISSTQPSARDVETG
jgi:hypothetical protein